MPLLIAALQFALMALLGLIASAYAEAIIAKREAHLKMKEADEKLQKRLKHLKTRWYPRYTGDKIVTYCPDMDVRYANELETMIEGLKARKISLQEGEEFFKIAKQVSGEVNSSIISLRDAVQQYEQIANQDLTETLRRIDLGEVVRKRGLRYLGGIAAFIATCFEAKLYAEAAIAAVEMSLAQECYDYYSYMEKAPDFGSGCGHGQGTPEVFFNPFGEPMLFQINGRVDDDITINGQIWKPHPNPLDDGQYKRPDCASKNSSHNFSTWFVVGENEKTLINYKDNQGANMGAEYWITMYTLEEGMKYARPPKF